MYNRHKYCKSCIQLTLLRFELKNNTTHLIISRTIKKIVKLTLKHNQRFIFIPVYKRDENYWNNLITNLLHSYLNK